MVRRRQEEGAGSGRAALEGEENHYCQLRWGVVIIIVVLVILVIVLPPVSIIVLVMFVEPERSQSSPCGEEDGPHSLVQMATA